jgi:hypothetical protein
MKSGIQTTGVVDHLSEPYHRLGLSVIPKVLFAKGFGYGFLHLVLRGGGEIKDHGKGGSQDELRIVQSQDIFECDFILGAEEMYQLVKDGRI